MWLRNPDIDELSELSVVSPVHTILGQHAFLGLDHHWSEPIVATCGVDVQVWDHQRSEPIHTLTWGSESVLSVRFNPVERQMLASTGSDRSTVLHDLRSATAIRKLVTSKRSNKMCWNPMEAFHFVLANEDHNLYTFDMRKMDCAVCVHMDHVSKMQQQSSKELL
jgi:WD repeat and SOF domain-containing protein 1